MVLILFSAEYTSGEGAAWRTNNFALNQVSATAAFVSDVAGALECPAEPISGSACAVIKTGVTVGFLAASFVVARVS
jgi:hypothetical protein